MNLEEILRKRLIEKLEDYEYLYLIDHISELDKKQLRCIVNTSPVDRLRDVAREELILRAAEPHWTVPWTFWAVLISILIALWAWLFPRLPVDANSSPNYPQPVIVPQPSAPIAPTSLSSSPHPASTQSAVSPKESQRKSASAGTNSVAAPASPNK